MATTEFGRLGVSIHFIHYLIQSRYPVKPRQNLSVLRYEVLRYSIYRLRFPKTWQTKWSRAQSQSTIIINLFTKYLCSFTYSIPFNPTFSVSTTRWTYPFHHDKPRVFRSILKALMPREMLLRSIKIHKRRVDSAKRSSVTASRPTLLFVCLFHYCSLVPGQKIEY
jgi:hypothetical protein